MPGASTIASTSCSSTRSRPRRCRTRSLDTHGGRDVAGQFAHVHAIRITWLESFKKDFAKGLVKLDAKGHPTKGSAGESR